MNLDTIVCMDALEFLRTLPDDSVDMALTSPPYDDLRKYNGYSFEFEPIAHEAYRVLKPGGVLAWVAGDSVVNGSETLTSMRQAIFFVDSVGFNMHDTMIYYKDGKPYPDKQRYYQSWEFMFVLSKGKPRVANLLQIKTSHTNKTSSTERNKDGTTTPMKYAMGKPTRNLDNVWMLGSGWGKTTKDDFAYKHPAMFPEKLARDHILTWSNPGDLILDFFMGAGTTAKMARVTGRKFIGCDISQEYVDIALKRVPTHYTPDMFDTLLAGGRRSKPEQLTLIK